MGMYSMIRIGERIHVTRVLMAFLAGGWHIPSLVSNPRRPFRFGDDARRPFTQETPEAAEQRKITDRIRHGEREGGQTTVYTQSTDSRLATRSPSLTLNLDVALFQGKLLALSMVARRTSRRSAFDVRRTRDRREPAGNSR